MLGACEHALRAGLLTEPVPGTVEFSHDLVREVLDEEVPRLRRGRVHAAALEVLWAATRRPGGTGPARARRGAGRRPRPGPRPHRGGRPRRAPAAGHPGGGRPARHRRAPPRDRPRRARAPPRAAVRAGRRRGARRRGPRGPRAAHHRARRGRRDARHGAGADGTHQRRRPGLLRPVQGRRHRPRPCRRAGGLLDAEPPLPPADRSACTSPAPSPRPHRVARCASDIRAAEHLVDEHGLEAGLRCRALNAGFWSELTPTRWDGSTPPAGPSLAAARRPAPRASARSGTTRASCTRPTPRPGRRGGPPRRRAGGPRTASYR